MGVGLIYFLCGKSYLNALFLSCNGPCLSCSHAVMQSCRWCIIFQQYHVGVVGYKDHDIPKAGVLQ